MSEQFGSGRWQQGLVAGLLVIICSHGRPELALGQPVPMPYVPPAAEQALDVSVIAQGDLPAPIHVLDVTPWWDETVHSTMLQEGQSITLTLDQVIWYALQNSAQIQVFSDLPLIREQAIIEADAAFDWYGFFDTRWNDLSEPVGSTLTVRGGGTRFSDHNFSASAGARRRNQLGGTLEVAQKIGTQNTNSNFFIPQNQGTSRLSLSYTQPLLRGQGEAYNRSLIVLANIDTGAAHDELHRELQSHLLEVTRAFWGLYLERGALVQKLALFRASVDILKQLEARQELGANPTQILRAKAAVAERRAELIRAVTAIKNAEARMRGLVNAQELGDAGMFELVPLDRPLREYVAVEVPDSMAAALQMRPEINQAMKDIQAGGVRLNMAKHELLPILNLVAETHVSGLQGSNNVGGAISNQFGVGAPSYSIGVQFEVPLGNRAANAREIRRQLELRQMHNRFRSTTETIKVEVEVAVREIDTAYREMLAKHEQMLAVALERDAIAQRWNLLPGQDGTAALVFDQLLRAQERVTSSEFQFLQAEMTCNLAMMNHKRATGMLLQEEGVYEGRFSEGGIPRITQEKSDVVYDPTGYTAPVEVQ